MLCRMMTPIIRHVLKDKQTFRVCKQASCCIVNPSPSTPSAAAVKYLHFSPSHQSNGNDGKNRSLMVIENLKNVKSTPSPVLILGLSGLIPFVAAPAYIALSGIYMPSVAHAQLAYGACILSFLGGVRWGLSVSENNLSSADWYNIGYSVVPSLIAWPALLMSDSAGLIAVITGLALTTYMDMTMIGYPSWFKGLRFILTFVAVLSLWTTFIYSVGMKVSSTSANEEN